MAATELIDPFPSLEGTNIFGSECEPFALFAFGSKASVPIVLDARRVVRLYVMDRLQLLGKLDRDFSFSPQSVVRPADLVLSARTVLEEIDIADREKRRGDLSDLRFWLRDYDLSPKGGHVVVAWVCFAKGKYTGHTLGL